MSELNFMHENISGIYNYCDRWCEKCSYTSRCLLFKQEAEREIKYLLKDENESDSEHYSKLLADEMKDVEKLFSQKPDTEDFLDSLDEDEDFDIDEGEDEDDEDDFEEFLNDEDNISDTPQKSSNPLVHLSEEMIKEFDIYYDFVKTKCPKEVEKYDPDNPLIKNLQILNWYIPQITIKIRMSSPGKNKTEKAKSKWSKEIEEEMFNVNSRIAYVGIKNCLKALNEIQEQRKELETETMLFLSMLKIIRQKFLEEFPKAETYRRPYFD